MPHGKPTPKTVGRLRQSRETQRIACIEPHASFTGNTMSAQAQVCNHTENVPANVWVDAPVAKIALRNPPSQKELAAVFQITPRHPRRWETLETASGRPCSHPYLHADLWRLYQHRRNGCWDRSFAAQIGLAEIFEEFDRIRASEMQEAHQNEQPESATVAMMLRCLAYEKSGADGAGGFLSRVASEGLATAARSQLRAILECERASAVLRAAFFEAALIAESDCRPKFEIPASTSIAA